jgi:hypothetical protein
VTEIFFSYKSEDRDSVRPVRDALVQQGFDVFWDQQVPANVDWDVWIRKHLAASKCAVVFWSPASAASDNVRHEATVAKQQGKLIPVLLAPLSADQFPMGLYTQQGVNLAGWNGDLGNSEWIKLRREVETKLTPGWVRQRIDELEAEIVAERARREGAENRDRVLFAQIAKEAQAQQELRRERDRALENAAAFKAQMDELMGRRAEIDARAAEEWQRRSEAEHNAKQRETDVQELTGRVAAAEQARAEAEHRLAEQTSRMEILTAELAATKRARHEAEAQQRKAAEKIQRVPSHYKWVATVGFGALLAAILFLTYSRVGPNSNADVALPRQGSSAASAEPPNPVVSPTGKFTMRTKTEAVGNPSDPAVYVKSIGLCEQKCAASAKCAVFSYSAASNSCYLFADASYKTNPNFDTGIRGK